MTDQNIYETPASDLTTDEKEELVYAGFWIRAAAAILDTIFIMLITFPLIFAVYGNEYWMSEAFVQGPMDILISYIMPAVVVVVFWIYKSATPGKMIFGLKVVSLGEKRELSTLQAIGRYLSYYPASLVLCLGIFWVAFDKRKQGWHDKLANTAVIRS